MNAFGSQFAQKLKKQQINLKLVEFSDYNQPISLD
jgi:ABC-type metal ion transport system, periplasmic component/surface antigen